MPAPINRQWLVARRPRGLVGAGDFRWVETAPPVPEQGEVLVRNVCLSCDPTQWGWMVSNTYLPMVRIGEVMRSFAVGRILESRDPRFRKGQLVQGLFGWQDYCATRDGDLQPILAVPAGATVEAALGILGYTGMAAYFGLLEIGQPRTGETVLVSGAAGATGSVVGQIATIVGCRVVGIAGGPDKCAYLTRELGFDAAIDYKADNIMTRLRETCPRGVDVYFDNVGGATLDAALMHLARQGRIVVCGAMSTYNDDVHAAVPRNYLQLLMRRARMQGFVVLDYARRADDAISKLSAWLREGKLLDRVDVQHGLENAPATLARLFRGENRGKQLLRIAEDPSSAPAEA
jgi:NADPH-dependent curcumin reductase CurA